MVKFFDIVSDIAIEFEKNVFNNYDILEKDSSEIYSYCTQIIENRFKDISEVKSIISKDKKEFIEINKDGEYIVSYVSIDNIELLDTNFSLGSIFGIYKDSLDGANLQEVIYVTYGPTFEIVYATKGSKVVCYAFDNGSFKEKEQLVLNDKGKINSTAGDYTTFSIEHKELIDAFFADGYRLRFSDSLALDTHQILFKKGGIYSSPSTSKDPNGTLNMIFEAYPISFIIELANGESIDGNKRILDLKTKDLDTNTPIYFGSKYEIDKLRRHYAS